MMTSPRPVAVYTFAWEVFKPRVTKHRNKLESIRKLVEEHGSFTIPENEALYSFFSDLDKILAMIDDLEGLNTVPQMFTELLHHMYMDWLEKNLITEDDSQNELLTVLGRLDVLVTENKIGCSVRRWALKIMSYAIASIRLFKLTRSRRLRSILQGEFNVTILESPPPQPPYVVDLSPNTIRQALDTALPQPTSVVQADECDYDAFVEYASEKTIQLNQTDKPSRSSPFIHAELAMLSCIDAGTIMVFPYIGVSKLSCLMCSSYIEAYSQVDNKISVRGCHGKVYPSWAWPTLNTLGICAVFLKKIREELKQEFDRFVEFRRTRRLSDSSVGLMSENKYADKKTTESIWERWQRAKREGTLGRT